MRYSFLKILLCVEKIPTKNPNYLLLTQGYFHLLEIKIHILTKKGVDEIRHLLPQLCDYIKPFVS